MDSYEYNRVAQILEREFGHQWKQIVQEIGTKSCGSVLGKT